MYDTTHACIIEQININTYIYNDHGTIGLAKVQTEGEKKELKRYITIGSRRYYVPRRPILAQDYYYVPSQEECQAFVNGELQPREIPEIVEDLRLRLKTLFDFHHDEEVELWVLPPP